MQVLFTIDHEQKHNNKKLGFKCPTPQDLRSIDTFLSLIDLERGIWGKDLENETNIQFPPVYCIIFSIDVYL